MLPSQVAVYPAGDGVPEILADLTIAANPIERGEADRRRAIMRGAI